MADGCARNTEEIGLVRYFDMVASSLTELGVRQDEVWIGRAWNYLIVEEPLVSYLTGRLRAHGEIENDPIARLCHRVPGLPRDLRNFLGRWSKLPLDPPVARCTCKAIQRDIIDKLVIHVKRHLAGKETTRIVVLSHGLQI